MKKYRFMTANGDYYDIDGDGCFLRSKNGQWQHPHDSWKVRGVYEIISFGQWRYHSLDYFIGMIENGDSFTFKNGKPRYTIADIDNGTMRGWGNTEYHGIKAAWVI